MNHASKSHDAFELLQEMRDRIDAVMTAEQERQQKLHTEPQIPTAKQPKP